MSRAPIIEVASDHSVLVRFGTSIDAFLHRQVRALLESFIAEPLAGVLNLHPAYASLLIDVDPRVISVDALEQAVRQRVSRGGHSIQPGDVIEIPVCYGGNAGPDLEPVAAHARLTPDDVIARHSASEYLVYFLGFSPGFPYLGGMDESIAAPRLATPRRSVPGGSIGIAGGQTGVYPLASPGGWRIIGRTPLRLFDYARQPASLLRMGDRVRFRPISRAELEEGSA